MMTVVLSVLLTPLFVLLVGLAFESHIRQPGQQPNRRPRRQPAVRPEPLTSEPGPRAAAALVRSSVSRSDT